MNSYINPVGLFGIILQLAIIIIGALFMLYKHHQEKAGSKKVKTKGKYKLIFTNVWAHCRWREVTISFFDFHICPSWRSYSLTILNFNLTYSKTL